MSAFPLRFADRVLHALLPPDDAEAIAGDLEEGFHKVVERSGRVRAALTWVQQLSSILFARAFNHPPDFPEPRNQKTTMASLRHDLAFAARSLRRQPGFTATAVVMLALGIGANVAIFSLVNAVLVRPLPFAHADRLMLVHMLAPDRDAPGTYSHIVWSYPKYEVLRDTQSVFQSIAAYCSSTWNITGSSLPERVVGEMVASPYFATLGVRPQLGRVFTADETRTGGSEPLVILSDGFWTRRYGRASTVIGQTIGLNGVPHTIVGVLPSGFRGLTGQADVWVPVTTMPAELLNEKWNHSYLVVARLEPGVSTSQADAAVRTIGNTINEQFPDPGGVKGAFGATAAPLDDHRADPIVRRSILLLLAAVAAVLLVVCINVANLTLVRALGRQREVAIRLALGASRARIIRQLMTESLLLASIGAFAGIGVAYLLVSAGASMMPDLRMVLPRGDVGGLTRVALGGLSLDSRVLLFTALLVAATATLFGLGPAWRASRRDLTDAMKIGTSGAVSLTRRGAMVRNAMVVVEIALALVLMTAGGLLVKSMMRLQATELGFNPSGLFAVRVGLPAPQYTPQRATQFLVQLVDRVGAHAEVESVAYGSCAPVSGGCNATMATFPGRPPVSRGSEPVVGIQWVSTGYFDTLGIRLLKGRFFSEQDRMGGRKVVLINETAARRFWGNEDPIGKRIAVGQGGFSDGADVVGVVADVRYGAVETTVRPDVYLPLLQSTRASGHLFVRGRGSYDALVPAVRAEIRSMDPDIPLTDIKTMEARFAEATWRTRTSAWLLGAFAALSLLLAALGVYGVITQGVQQRTREIGVRLALGAARRDILRLVIGRAFAIAVIGIGLGVLLAVPSMRLLTTLLYQVTPGDPLVLGTLASLLLTVALLAAYMPARRATRVDPLKTLRAE